MTGFVRASICGLVLTVLSPTQAKAQVVASVTVATNQIFRGESITELKPALDGIHHFRALQPERVAAIANIFKLP